MVAVPALRGITTGCLSARTGHLRRADRAEAPERIGLGGQPTCTAHALSCSSARVFAPRFFQAPPRSECCFALALRYPFVSIGLGRGLAPPSCRTCLAHIKNTWATRPPRVVFAVRFYLAQAVLQRGGLSIESAQWFQSEAVLDRLENRKRVVLRVVHKT